MAKTDESFAQMQERIRRRKRFRAAISYAEIDGAGWALANGVTIQHINAAFRGERAMSKELEEKMDAFIAEQFSLMAEDAAV